jgi:hypothetical protein
MMGPSMGPISANNGATLGPISAIMGGVAWGGCEGPMKTRLDGPRHEDPLEAWLGGPMHEHLGNLTRIPKTNTHTHTHTDTQTHTHTHDVIAVYETHDMIHD